MERLMVLLMDRLEVWIRTIPNLTLTLFCVFLALLLLFMWNSRQRSKITYLNERYNLVRLAVERLKPEKGLENNLTEMLEMFDRVIDATVYAFYVYEPKNGVFLLKAVRHSAKEFSKVRPSYSGLLGYKKEEYSPPLSLSSDAPLAEVGRIVEGEVPLIEVPLGERRGFIRIGQVQRKLKKRERLMLGEMGGLLRHSLATLIDSELNRIESEVIITSGRAIQQINHLALQPRTLIDMVIRLSIQTIQAAGGCYLEKRGGNWEIPIVVGIDEDSTGMLAADDQIAGWLESRMGARPYKLLKRSEKEFNELPPYLAKVGIEEVAIVAVDAGTDRNLLIFWFNRPSDAESEHAIQSTMSLIYKDVKVIISQQVTLRQQSGLYAGVLKGLARMLDNLGPYTVGYSDMMSLYSIVIAKQLRLPEEEIRDIALAAYLSNIGMFGISAELYQKGGKYTEQEFQLMKLHSEVGASIVRMTIGNEQAADMILHHHERVDGNGYPAALKGEDIPTGARIIAVVQTFLAKIYGRKHRDPLPFHQALQTLRSASGTQLDSHIVDCLIGWFERKQRNPQFNGKSLGSCWEMCSAPSSVCEHCPVFGRTDVNCWEVEGNHCLSHGQKCATCFVRTEFVHRAESLKKMDEISV